MAKPRHNDKPEYHRIDANIWDDEKFQKISPGAKLVFMLLLTHPKRTSIGTLRSCWPGGLSDYVNLSIDEVRAALAEICEAGLAKRDEKKGLIFLPDYIKQNPPTSAKRVKEWVEELDNLPDCDLKNNIVWRCRAAVANCPERLRKAFAALDGRVNKGTEKAAPAKAGARK
jgi:hypothetical protein